MTPASAKPLWSVPTVFLSHSLGTVACDLLKWKVPLFVSLGFPLAIVAIEQPLRGQLSFRMRQQRWYNVMHSLDIVALNRLDAVNFDVEPAIENSEGRRVLCDRMGIWRIGALFAPHDGHTSFFLPTALGSRSKLLEAR